MKILGTEIIIIIKNTDDWHVTLVNDVATHLDVKVVITSSLNNDTWWHV